MKFLFRWAFRLLIFLIVLLVAAVLLLDTIVKALLEKSIATQTGLTAQIGRVDVGLIHPKFHLENVTLYNRTEFGGGPMITMPELHVEYDFGALRARQVHLRLVRVNVGEVQEVLDATGTSSFKSLEKQAQTSVAGTNQVATADDGWEFTGIDTLNLTVGKFKRTRLGKPDATRETSLNLNNVVLTNLKSAEDVQNKLLPVLLRSGLKLLSEGFFSTYKPPATLDKTRSPAVPKK